MKTILVTVIFLTLSFNPNITIAQDETESTLSEPKEEIFKVVEEMPRFPGCEGLNGTNKEKDHCAKEKMLEYIRSVLVYPEKARSNQTEGMAVVQFKVWKDGTIRDVKIVRNPGDGTGEEAARIVNDMNEMQEKWRPGHQRSRPVITQYTLPIKFKLDEKKSSRRKNNRNPSSIIYLTNLDERPVFPDCKNRRDKECSSRSFQKFIKENQIYPEQALENKTEGIAKISFIIEKDGSISNIKALNNLPDGLTEDAIEVIEWMNSEDIKWIPGKLNRRSVRTRCEVYIKYNLADWRSRN